MNSGKITFQGATFTVVLHWDNVTVQNASRKMEFASLGEMVKFCKERDPQFALDGAIRPVETVRGPRHSHRYRVTGGGDFANSAMLLAWEKAKANEK